MINSVNDLLEVLKANDARHWQLFKTYNRADPSPVATSEAICGEEPTLELSINALQKTFNALSSGNYFLKYNTKNMFNRGYMSTEVSHQTEPLNKGNQGIAGIGNIAGYINESQLNDKLELQRKDYEILTLKSRLDDLENNNQNGGVIGGIMKLINANPQISEAIGGVISKIAGNNQLQKVIPAKVGTIGVHENKNGNITNSDNENSDVPLPEHLDKLTDAEFEKIQMDMLNVVIELWAIDADFPVLLPKLLALAKNNPSQYNIAKTLLK